MGTVNCIIFLYASVPTCFTLKSWELSCSVIHAVISLAALRGIQCFLANEKDRLMLSHPLTCYDGNRPSPQFPGVELEQTHPELLKAQPDQQTAVSLSSPDRK